MKRITAVSLVFVWAVLWAAGCNGTAPATALPDTKSSATSASTTSAQAATWQADGVISAGEYPHQATLDSITVYYRNDAQNLYLALQAQDVSFLAFAVAPKGTMADANFLIGTVTKGVVKVEDQFGASFHTHTLDTTLGGKDDIVASGGSQQNGVTIWEAQIPLDSGDNFDIALKPGQTVTFIVASRSADNLTSPHTFHTSGQIQLD